MSSVAQRTALGAAVQAAANDLAALRQTTSDLAKRYSDLGAFADSDLASLPGAPTAAALTNMITLINQFQAWLGNQSVTQGDYQSTLDNFRGV